MHRGAYRQSHGDSLISLQIVQQVAAQVVSQVLAGHNLNQVLDATLRAQSALTIQQRAAIQDFSYGTLRYYGRLQAQLDALMQKPLTDQRVRFLLLVALYQLNYDRASDFTVVNQAVEAARKIKKPWAAGLVNGVLRNFLRQKSALEQQLDNDEVARYSYPQWWINKIKQAYPAGWQAILEAGNQHPPMTLRVNRRLGTSADYCQALVAAEVSVRTHTETAITLDKPVPVQQLPGFEQGRVSVQDAGAQHAARLLDVADGMRVLDACCAPGGKTGHLLELADLNLLGLDADADRLKRVKQNLQRLGLHAELRVGDAAKPAEWWDGQSFDRILADVPCSASGVVRRHVDIKWLRRESDIALFAAQQTEILQALWQLLAKGGKLLYATCSIFHEENQQQIDQFLKQQPDAKQLSLAIPENGQFLPCADYDGFFYALLQKT